MLETIFALLVIFQLKHFLADFLFQNEYMHGKFKDDWAFFLPLMAHVCVHAILTFAITYAFTQSLGTSLLLQLFDLSVHFTMDRLKAGKNYLGRWKALSAKEFPSASMAEKNHNKYFWWSLGLDQSVNHLTHYMIIYFIVQKLQ